MSLIKNRLKKIEEKIKSGNNSSLWAKAFNGIVIYKGIEYEIEDFKRLFPHINIIDRVVIDKDNSMG